LRLVSEKTLLEETLARLEGFIPRECILILTNTEQESAVSKVARGICQKGNILAEPAKRDTAAAIALGTGWVAARDHAAIMVVLHGSRHCKWAGVSGNTGIGCGRRRRNKRACHDRHQPTWACPGFGYIEHGKPIRLRKRPTTKAIHRVVRFREKTKF